MSNIFILNKEKEKYTKILSELVILSDKTDGIISEEEKNKRLFYIKLLVLKKYVDFLDDLTNEYIIKEKNFQEKNFGFLNKLLGKKDNFNYDEDAKQKITTYKEKIMYDLTRLEKCQNCKCVSCFQTCKIEHCKRCRITEYVSDCNNQDCLSTTNEEIKELYDEEGNPLRFNLIHFLLKKNEDDSFIRYVLMIDLNDFENQQICKFIDYGKEFYLESIDEETLNYIYEQFIEMGVRI